MVGLVSVILTVKELLTLFPTQVLLIMVKPLSPVLIEPITMPMEPLTELVISPEKLEIRLMLKEMEMRS